MGSQRFSAVFLVLSLFFKKTVNIVIFQIVSVLAGIHAGVVENNDAHIDVFLHAGSFYKH